MRGTYSIKVRFCGKLLATKIITYMSGIEGRHSQHNLWQKLAVSPEQRVDFVTEDCYSLGEGELSVCDQLWLG